jgi:hypothetical protein
MHSEWLAAEHYRIHVMERADGPRREAGLAAARSDLESLARTMPKGPAFACAICASRRQTVTVLPSALRVQKVPSGLAA